ncbi:phage tail protein [Flavobacterium amnicola]|uniref:Phage tail protein n=1 Tax=Flavobacterium amnicola TaxID=2506422 RepID=A0A4Q1K6I8_9FLAO|nr:tail fiber protein [Flavobacterium amnicola]RXR21287.1 phage tail protein [Flavobacterium amnicola]
MKKITFCLVLLFSCLTATKSFAQDGYIGEIRMVGFTFEPRGWAFCDGRILSIASNTALFSILGTTYGGNGTTTFALPDLRGRAPIHVGASQGPGLSPVSLGQMSGQEIVTLTPQNVPSHTHAINATTADGTSGNPESNIPANTKLLDKEYSDAAANTTMSPAMVQPAGNNTPFNNMQPYLGMNYVICLQGIYPPRN